MSNMSAGAVALDLELQKGNLKQQVNSCANEVKSAVTSALGSVGKIVGTVFAVDKVIKFTDLSVKAASKMQSAWTGLNSIVTGTGNSFSVAEKFINDFTKDGLMSVEETAAAYKNLLSRGYDTSQIENTLTALKDSAAFGRQASYNLGEAVVGATEGLKNENSILVDNAGVTKNVAKMWEEYANELGVATTSLTQAQKIQAEYNGIMKETRFQVGDAATYTKTYAGQVQMLKASVKQLEVAFGKVVIPIAQLFIPVINGAVNALTRLFNGMQLVLKLFGLEMPNMVSKASSSITGMSSDMSDAGKTAVATAKKINKAFASVDEIQVVSTKSNDNSSGNTNNDIGGTSMSIIPTIASDSAIDTAVSGTMEKIKKYIEPLQNIKFDNLINSFNNLKKSIEPITDTIGQGLQWLYFNVLVPFTSWTIQDVIPSFFNILSGALDVVNVAIDNVKPLFDWLWKEILQPIASWTGGVIVDVLNGIGDALKWISEHELAVTILESLGIAIGIVAGALTLWNIAVGIWNSIGVIATAVTTGFGTAVAILTSPITLVILAITALIAIIILCVKHWDKIKAAAASCWEGIKSAWGSVKDWFKNKVVDPISDLFSKLAQGIANTFKTPINFIIDGINTFLKGINKIKIPDWVPGVGGKGFNIKPIQRLAQGGYVQPRNPQLAIIGDNTREGEVVSPESKIYEQQMKAIKDSGLLNRNSSGGITEMHIYLHYEDGRTIIKKVNQAQIDAGEILLMT